MPPPEVGFLSSACYSGCNRQLSVPAGMPLLRHHGFSTLSSASCPGHEVFIRAIGKDLIRELFRHWPHPEPHISVDFHTVRTAILKQ